MKKKILALVLAATLTISALTGCNKDIIDTVYTFNYAVIKLPNGEIVEGKVDKWRDYEDSEQLQVTIDGTVYLTSPFNCTLIQN
jgi:hypothetical protein